MRKMSMEIMYVPVANLQEKRDMMEDWKRTSSRAESFSFISAVACGAMFATMKFIYAFEFSWVYVVLGLLFLLSAFFMKKWWLWGYILPLLSAVGMFALGTYFYQTGCSLDQIVCGFGGGVICLSPLPFAMRCYYNHSTVFVYLKQSKGFPNFIFNTADLLGDKIYLKDKKLTEEQKRQEISFNPFKEDEEKARELFYQQQNLKYKDKDIRKETVKEKATIYHESVPKKYKYGKKIGDFYIIFPHNDIIGGTHEEHRAAMDHWRRNINLASEGFSLYFFIYIMAIFSYGYQNSGFFLLFVLCPLFIMGVNYVKMSNRIGPVLIALAYCIMLMKMNNVITLAFMIGFLICARWLIISSVRMLLNHKMYRELSTQPGFPSFIQNTADLYGGQMYVVEEDKNKNVSVRNTEKIVMDIGFDEDEDKKRKAKAWNAFDENNYKDEDDLLPKYKAPKVAHNGEENADRGWNPFDDNHYNDEDDLLPKHKNPKPAQMKNKQSEEKAWNPFDYTDDGKNNNENKEE